MGLKLQRDREHGTRAVKTRTDRLAVVRYGGSAAEILYHSPVHSFKQRQRSRRKEIQADFPNKKILRYPQTRGGSLRGLIWEFADREPA